MVNIQNTALFIDAMFENITEHPVVIVYKGLQIVRCVSFCSCHT